MQRVKLQTILAGPNGNGHPGDILNMTDEAAEALVAGRFAVAVDVATPDSESDGGDSDGDAAEIKPITLTDLRIRARELNIDGRSNMDRATLEAMIAEAEAALEAGDGTDEDWNSDATAAVAAAEEAS